VRFLGARVTTVADHLEAELLGAKVPYQRRSAARRVVLHAKRVPSRGVFGEATDGDALDATLRELVERKVLFWAGKPLGPDDRPRVYRFRHKSGIPVWVTAAA
jgi:hypothetical protein